MTALDRPGPDATRPVETPRQEIGVDRSADLQSSRVPPPDATPQHRPEPFYREVWLTREDVAKIEIGVATRIAAGSERPEQRAELVAAGKEKEFAHRALTGDFYSLSKYGTLESTMFNATPPHWYGGGAEGRLYEVTAPAGTTYFVGRVAPQTGVQRHPEDPARTLAPPRGGADVPGGSQQAYVPRETDRTGWVACPVARSPQELAALPGGSVVGYDDNEEIVATPDSAHACDLTTAVHLPGNGDPFEKADAAARDRALASGRAWDGPVADKFSGPIDERVTRVVVLPETARPTPGASIVSDPLLGQGPLVAGERDRPLIR